MSCGQNFFGNLIPVTGGGSGSGGGGLPVYVREGLGINVLDSSDTTKYDFTVSREIVVALEALLTLTAREAGVARANPVLKGTVIDELILSWTYNQTVVLQTLVNSGALTPPTLIPSDRAFTYTGQSVQSNLTLTLSGNTGQGAPESVDTDAKSVTFGNYMWIGHGTSKINTATASLETFLETLTSIIKTSRAHTYNATGGVNEKHFVAYPKSFGLATFTKPPFVGGYVRLKNVAGLIKSDLGIGDVESDIVLTNNKGFAEAYYIYESLVDNQNDPVTAFTIS